MNKFTKPISILLGSIYLFSGIAKGSDIDTFGSLVASYGGSVFIAPVVVGLEIFLGFGLLFLLSPRLLGKVSFYFLCGLTVVLGYGFFVKDIDDCGCFGNVVSISPFFSFLKNGLMTLLSWFLWKSALESGRYQAAKMLIFSALGLISITINTIELINVNAHQSSKIIGQDISKSFLGKYITKNQNEETILFLFNPKCSHCQTVAKQLTKSKIRVTGLYPDSNSQESLKMFAQETELNFDIYPIKLDSAMKYIYNFPVVIVVKNGKVERVQKSYWEKK